MKLKKPFAIVVSIAPIFVVFFVSVLALAQSSVGQWAQMVAPDAPVNVMTTSGSTLLAGTSGGGVYRYDSEGQTWKPSSSGLFVGANVRAFADIGTSLFIGTDKGVYRSNDQGQSWAEANAGLAYNAAPRSIGTLVAVGSLLFAGADQVEGATGITTSIYRSDDLGKNWIEVKNGLPAIASCSSLAIGAAGLFAATNAGVYRSVDNGQNWISANFNEAFEVAVIGPNVFAARQTGVWRSTDQGLNWTQVLVPRSNVKKLVASGVNLYVLSHYFSSPFAYYSYIQFSPDLGKSWFDTKAPTELNFFPVPANTIYANGDKIYAFYPNLKIYLRSGFFSPWIATVSAASYSDWFFASESLAASFGTNLAKETQAAGAIPLPTELAGTSVRLKDSTGIERFAPLLFVSPGQINYQIPPGTANGVTTITIISNGETVGMGGILVQQVAPALFTANADGSGVPAAVVMRVKADGSSQYEPVAQFDNVKKAFVPKPIDLGTEADRVYLVLFGTGWRHRNSLEKVIIGFDRFLVQVPAIFAGPQPDFTGVDQANVLIPRTLAGRGEVVVTLMADDKFLNETVINIK